MARLVDDPAKPAWLVRKFGYDLLMSQGVKPSFYDRVKDMLLEKGVAEVVRVAVILVAILLGAKFLSLKIGM